MSLTRERCVAGFVALYSTPAEPEAFEQNYRNGHLPLILRTPGLERVEVFPVRRSLRGDPCVLPDGGPQLHRRGCDARWYAQPRMGRGGENLASFGGVELATMFTVGDPEILQP